MRFHFLPAVLLPIALFTIACSGDDGPPLGGDVVGSWRELPNATDDTPPALADRMVFTFDDAGNVTQTSSAQTMVGTYTTNGDEVVLKNVDDQGVTHTTAFPYRATDDRFVLGALVAVGDTQGMVGAWNASITDDDSPRTVDLTLRADMTATYAFTGDTSVTWQGTWRAIGNDLEVLLMPDANTTVHLHASLIDHVLGGAFEKI